MRVVFPAPVGPTIAIVFPAGIVKDTFLIISPFDSLCSSISLCSLISCLTIGENYSKTSSDTLSEE